ncbi:MAG: Eco57I restriction-modification methylase domain-containing protein [Pyrinomonadaceae bacterium]
MPVNNLRVRQLIRDFDFKRLFVEELGWDRFRAQPIEVVVDGASYGLSPLAEKRGFQVFECSPDPEGNVPERPARMKIERQLTKLAFEHLVVFVNRDRSTQRWQWVRREPGKPLALREETYVKGQSGERLQQKLVTLAFSLEEEESITVTDPARRVRQGFDVERVTKRFYDRFNTEHAAFLKFVKGIQDQGDREWYTSLMLNRLMFVYFIQKKGFLDGDLNYLRNRLRVMREKKGGDKFLSFYRHFLLRLFHEGLGQQGRNPELDRLLGRVPYLNGGLFDVHELERSYTGIQIADEAFENIFTFFDTYQWHLDERPLRADNEINPDVLGYIFEKYINQKEMGAYYTKEDVTEYISRNTIIPFIFEAAEKSCAIAFRPDGFVWRLIQDNPDRYIFEAVRKGAHLPLPKAIAGGVCDSSRREAWGRLADTEFGLPAETWRECVQRRERYQKLVSDIKAGEVQTINDLVTRNLDIRQFAQDVIESSESPDLVRACYYTMAGRVSSGDEASYQPGLSVLDPTCGSGAFLFAALNVMVPLYDACLGRMESFVSDYDRAETKHRTDPFSDFRAIIGRMNDKERHPNPHYFILKTIVLNNLYGVDLMEEAVEICKLRLFLKLVAQIERVEEIEPLPDIDFNIRAGNSLVGYATEAEVERAVTRKFDFEDSMGRIGGSAEVADRAFRSFREIQTRQDVTSEEIGEAKRELRRQFGDLERELNQYLAGDYGVDHAKRVEYQKWLSSHKPFHWFIDFNSIIKGGGFSVILGNPPYVEIPRNISRSLLKATFKTALNEWSRDEDLYTFIVERSLHLINSEHGKFGMILPLSVAFSTKRPYVAMRQLFMEEKGQWWWSHFDRIPSALFGNEVRTRCSITLFSRESTAGGWAGATTALMRWETERRPYLFPLLSYARFKVDIAAGIPKVGSQIQADALSSLLAKKTTLAESLTHSISFSALARAAPRFPEPCLYVGGTAYNWFPVWRDIPETTDMQGRPSLPARTAGYKFKDAKSADIAFALLGSSLGYWWWGVASDGFNLKKWLLDRFPVALSLLTPKAKEEVAALGAALRMELKRHYVYKDNKGRIGNYYLPACSAEVEAIDAALARNIKELSPEFFEDVRTFNQIFSRAVNEIETGEEG